MAYVRPRLASVSLHREVRLQIVGRHRIISKTLMEIIHLFLHMHHITFRDCHTGADPEVTLGGQHGEREPIAGVWGRSPQRGPGAEPLVRGSGGEAPLKLKAFKLLYV